MNINWTNGGSKGAVAPLVGVRGQRPWETKFDNLKPWNCQKAVNPKQGYRNDSVLQTEEHTQTWIN